MAESRARAFGNLARSVEPSGAITSSGISTEVSLGVDTYDSLGELPVRGLTNGDQAFVGNRLYISNGSGWYNVGLVNLAPSITSGPDGASFDLDSTNTVSLSLTAVDSDGTPIIWSFSTSDSATQLATITNDSDGSFNVTGKSLVDILAAGYDSTGGSFDITFRASDGISFDTDTASFTLTYSVSSVSFDWNNITQEERLVNTLYSGGEFGHSVAITGDRLFVSIPEEPAGLDTGLVEYFKRTGTSWSKEQLFDPADLDENQNSTDFGWSIAAEGDWLIVGSPNDSVNSVGTRAGQIYIWKYNSSTELYDYHSRFTPAKREYAAVGYSLDMSGDTFVVGATVDFHGSTGEGWGAAYVYRYNSGTDAWELEQELISTNLNQTDGTAPEYGESVSIDGDIAVVGSIENDNSGNTDAGSIHVFTRSGTTWTEAQVMYGPNAADEYGYIVSVSGNTLIYSSTAGEVVYVWVTDDDGSTWTQEQALTADNPFTGKQFGWGAKVVGDVIFAASRNAVSGGATGGDLQIFSRSGGSWSHEATLLPEAGDQIASNFYAGLSDNVIDFDPDNGTLVAGCRRGASGNGTAYVYTVDQL